jgi:hypothetical protein
LTSSLPVCRGNYPQRGSRLSRRIHSPFRLWNTTDVAYIVDIQKEIGSDVLGFVEEQWPDWLDEAAELMWEEMSGW